MKHDVSAVTRREPSKPEVYNWSRLHIFTLLVFISKPSKHKVDCILFIIIAHEYSLTCSGYASTVRRQSLRDGIQHDTPWQRTSGCYKIHVRFSRRPSAGSRNNRSAGCSYLEIQQVRILPVLFTLIGDWHCLVKWCLQGDWVACKD